MVIGYLIAEQVVGNTATEKVITPTKIPEVISLSVVNSSRFLIIGTKPEILEWLHTYSHIKLEVTLFNDENEAPHIHIPDVLIDLLPTFEKSGKSLIDYINPIHHPNPENAIVQLEFRPVNHKIDENVEPYFRVIVKRGSTFGEIIDEISAKWDSIDYPSIWDNVKHIIHDFINEFES
ncbi:8674_t:CDS:2 [Diversispora eburnea]|uniref:8674_t:CDS:1 n=1 Tax=Diversispora eburnea TaxID=1213867 RepID=A0A9N9C0N7_9GLOM|nr:8674_t:CDS:2 [Diversispora eburnea]